MKKAFLILMVILVLLAFTACNNEKNDKESCIKQGVLNEINEQVEDMMFVFSEDNIEMYIVKTDNGVYLVGVKSENDKVVYVDVEEKFM